MNAEKDTIQTRESLNRTLSSSDRVLSAFIVRLPPPLVRQPVEGFLVLRGRARDHIVRQRRRRAGLVPRLSFEPVADELLVERRRRYARLVRVLRPVPRAVRRQHLVDED